MLETTVVFVTPANQRRGTRGTGNNAAFWMYPVVITLASSSLALVATSTVVEELGVEGSGGSSSRSGGGIGSERIDVSDGLLSATAIDEQASKDIGRVVAETLASEEGKAAAVSMVESFLASLNALLAEYGLPSASVLCAALAVPILAFALIGRFSGGSRSSVRGGLSSNRRRGVVLFLGPCSSGKTAMCYRLCNGTLAPTVTSMQSYTYDCKRLTSNGKSTASLIDYPGHERLQGGVGKELRRADRLVFVMDGSCLSSQVAAGAELLYDILTDASVEGCRGLLLVLNKSDLKEAKISRAKLLLQKEIEKLRGTRGTLGTQGEEDDIPTAMALGRPGQPFNLEIDSPCEVEIVTCSVVKEGGLDPVEDFVRASVL